MSRKQKGSNTLKKAKRLVARAHEKISNARQDFLHKLSRKLVNENQVLISENLNVKGMLRNHKLAKAISGTEVTANGGCVRPRKGRKSSVVATQRLMKLEATLIISK
ncbi:MAG: hypothetical protein BRC41_18805 [Cyanobacteria bacterium QH_9_48_43]|nr:MAG: hypothetical protein BRC41_18805 [Cyanobacteria bacterium QH_9_48_43]